LVQAFLFSKERNGTEVLAAACREAEFTVVACDSMVNANGDSANLSALAPHLEHLSDDEAVLVIDADRMDVTGALHTLATAPGHDAEIILAADHRFDFPDERLARFYWKFHPRPGWPRPFASAVSLIGKASALRLMLREAARYSDRPDTAISDAGLVNRFYADQLLGLAQTKARIVLDTAQEFFAVTDLPRTASALTAIRRFEQDRVSGTVTAPASKAPLRRKAEAGDNRPALFRALARTVKILVLNRGETRPRKIFRYAANRNPEWQRAMETFRSHLESRTPFAFVHFNDGEMTFIKQFRQGDHQPNWFGRKQNRYNPELGEHLVTALTHRQENYFAGVPCPKCHPDLRTLADAVRPADDMTVPAMTLHHNLAHLPQLLARMRGRRIFWFKNAFQDPVVFRALGLSLEDADITNVPFREAHTLYGEMRARRFSEDAIVLMSCGMLAKILIPHWFATNPRTTFLAIGSAMDDLVQRSDPNYRPYPAGLPWTGDVQGRKSFLFGLKKTRCPVCFDIG